MNETNEGRLTDDERAELAGFVEFAESLALMRTGALGVLDDEPTR